MGVQTKKLGYKIGNFIIALILLAFAVMCIYPLLYVLFASVSDPTRLSQHTGLLLHPLGISREGYTLLFHNVPIFAGYANTMFIVVVGTVLNVFFSLLAAFVLSRPQLLLHKFLNKFVIFTMYFSGGMIPLFLVVKGLGLLDSRWALILPTLINTYNMIILKSSIEGIPSSLLESARIDGATEFTLLIKIIVPLVKPTIAVLVMYYAVEHWNAWFNAMIYIQSRDKYPLQLLLREILIGNNTVAAAMGADVDKYQVLTKYCASVVGALPILVLFPFLQKYFVKGVMAGAVKE